MFLAQVASSAAAALGVPGMHDQVGFGEARHCVIVLVDGLGWELLSAHAEHAPTLSALTGDHEDTVFPSTTPTALASLGTGLLPGMHGMVAGTFWLPEADVVLNPLQWPAVANPIAVQPEPTVFETAAAYGVSVSTIADGKYADSGLTRAVLRGGTYRPTDVATHAGRALAQATAGISPP